MKQDPSRSLLFEIGVEEIPSSYMEGAKASIRVEVPVLLAECGWECKEVNILTTPRRIVIHASPLHRLPAATEEKLGPSKEQAYQNGQPTEALRGFLRSVKLSERDVVVQETSRGPRVAVKIQKHYKPLSSFFETLPRAIKFPKLMRWDETKYTFTRPIRWTFAFVGTQRQNYRLGGVASGNFSFGHRFLAPQKIRVTHSNFEVFKQALKRRHVILEEETRVEMIKSWIGDIAHQDEELIKTVARLVEEPFAVRGTFQPEYLKLPSAVLTTCMSKYQRIFAQFSSAGRITNRFVAVINGPRKNAKAIAKNFESVLRSRLEDARFFFAEDRKSKLEDKVKDLKEKIFLGSLGSYYDKTKRLEALTDFLGTEAGCSKDVIRNAKRAAHLCKADLVTHLVQEFPELQGVAGSEYACLEGEDKAVVQAISGHYLPANLSEPYSKIKKQLNLEGALLGICDRIDLLVGALGLGIEPSSSEDPYALRRAAGGIVKIIRAHRIKGSLTHLIHSARDQFGHLISKSNVDLVKLLMPIFKERVAFELGVTNGTKPFEVLQGIFESGCEELADVFEKFEALVSAIDHDSFVRTCKVLERTGNILKGVAEKINDRIEPTLFVSPLERKLYELIDREGPKIHELIDRKEYRKATFCYGDAFFQLIHDFFEEVLVNHEDVKIRDNRRALINKVNRLYTNRVADLSRVTRLPV